MNKNRRSVLTKIVDKITDLRSDAERLIERIEAEIADIELARQNLTDEQIAESQDRYNQLVELKDNVQEAMDAIDYDGALG